MSINNITGQRIAAGKRFFANIWKNWRKFGVIPVYHLVMHRPGMTAQLLLHREGGKSIAGRAAKSRRLRGNHEQDSDTR